MLIITGSYPPHICGVGDYTDRLMTTECAKTWQLYHSSDWSLSSLVKHIRAINKTQERTLNIQYPTQGYGWSLVPHLLSIYYSWFTRKRFSVTVHEQSQLSLKARWAQKIILLTANRIIFTNDFERTYAINKLPFVKKRSTVIKIFSNIAVANRIKAISERTIDVVNFGHIRPRKGLEQFIEVIENTASPYKALIVGQVPEGYENYFNQIASRAQSANIDIRLNLSDVDVSELLNTTKVAYLPFPDGASERRGSLLASFSNGAVVATTIGKFTTIELQRAIVNIQDVPLDSLLKDTELLSSKQSEALTFLNEQMPHNWNDIAQKYIVFLE